MHCKGFPMRLTTECTRTVIRSVCKMDNPWFILIVYVPAYFGLAALITSIGAIAASRLARPRSHFLAGFAISCAALPVALALYVGVLEALASIAPELGAASEDQLWFPITLGGTLLVALTLAFYFPLRSR